MSEEKQKLQKLQKLQKKQVVETTKTTKTTVKPTNDDTTLIFLRHWKNIKL